MIYKVKSNVTKGLSDTAVEEAEKRETEITVKLVTLRKNTHS